VKLLLAYFLTSKTMPKFLSSEGSREQGAGSREQGAGLDATIVKSN
jgi:hypothetical protein